MNRFGKWKIFSFSPSLFQPSPFSLSFSLSAAQKTPRQPVSRRPVSLAPAISRPSQRRPFLSFSLSDAGDPPVIPSSGRAGTPPRVRAPLRAPLRLGVARTPRPRSAPIKASPATPLNPPDPQPPPLAFANPSSHPPQIRAWANAAPPFRRVSAAFELSRSFAPR